MCKKRLLIYPNFYLHEELSILQVFGDLEHLIEHSKTNNKLGHVANREEKIMYLETDMDGICIKSEESAAMPNPVMDSLFNANDDAIAKKSKNLAPVSRYVHVF